MTKQIKTFVEANKIVSEQGKWADEAWDEFMEEEALAEHPTNEDCSLVQEPAVWEHFDKAYQKAFTSSQPKDWMDAALMAQQVRNLQATPPKETQEPNGGMTDIVNKLIELRKMQSSNYNQTKKAFICDEAIAKIKELEALLKSHIFENKILQLTGMKKEEQIAELTARIEKDREYALSIKKNLERLWEIERLQELDK